MCVSVCINEKKIISEKSFKKEKGEITFEYGNNKTKKILMNRKFSISRLTLS